MKIDIWPIDKPVPYSRNARRISDAAVEKVAASIREFGWQQPIVVDVAGVVIAGHTRLLAAKKLNLAQVPVHVATELTPDLVKSYRLMDNRSHEETTWDMDLLKLELFDLKVLDFDLSLTGFDADELASVMVDKTIGQTDEDDVPESPVVPTTKTGDLWILGNHRLICGDSTQRENWERLGIDRGCVCFTSPPYNLGKSAHLSNNGFLRTSGNAYVGHDDAQGEPDYRRLLDASLSLSLHFCEASVFNVQPLAGSKRELLAWLNENSTRFVDVITWDKGNNAQPAMASSVLSSRFEWLCIFSPIAPASRAVPLSDWRGTLSNVYNAPPQRSNEFAGVHGATFPVHLPEFILSQLMNKSRGMVDCFCGTGTTLIAAEKLGKSGYGIEMSPEYCDVIVQRWQNFTGKSAALAEDGRTFDQVKDDRQVALCG